MPTGKLCSSRLLEIKQKGKLIISFINYVDLFTCSQQLGPSTTSITIYTTYPRQKLSEEDLVKTLAELGLAPSSTLIVAVVSLRSILGCF